MTSQLIQVRYESGGSWKDFTYRSSVKGLKIGDIVLVPATPVDISKGRTGPKRAIVTSLSSDHYAGPVVDILGKEET